MTHKGTVQGFYLSEELSDWDGNALTSEGIFVRTTTAVAGLTVGEQVTLTANVLEFQDFTNLNRTTLVNATNIIQANNLVSIPTLVLDGTAGKRIPNAILSDDNPNFFDSSDDPTDTFDPENDALDFYETIEGMRVTLPSVVVGDGFVAGSDNFIRFNAYSTVHAAAERLNSRGGYTLSGDPQFYPVDTATTQDDVIRGGSHVHDGASNPDMLELDFGNVGIGGTSGYDELLTMGDQLGDVTGIIDTDFGTMKLYVTQALDAAAVANLGGSPIREVTTLSEDARSLRIASYNVENLSPVGTTFSTNNGIEITTQAKIDAIASDIATKILAPDIIIVEEIQDNNGVTADAVTDASTTFNQLVAALNLATGKTYQWVDEAPEVSGTVGGAPGGNIRVGFLYDTARVQLGDLAANATLAERRQFTDRIGDGVRTAGDLIAFDDSQLGAEIDPSKWNGTRRSIMGEFTFNGNPVFVFGSHLPSKGGSGALYQLNQNIDAGAPANGDWQSRVELGQDIYALQNLVASASANNRVVSGGDFNEFWFSRPLETLTGYATDAGVARVGGQRFTNLMVSELSEAERFSYDFNGRSQALDTILSDQALAAVAEFDVAHINTGYNERNGAINPASSDHDPSLARFDFRSFGETLAGTAGADNIDGLGGNDTLIGSSGNDTLTGSSGNDTLDGGSDNDIAVFSGSRSDYTLVKINGTSGTVTDNRGGTPDGIDTLNNIETLQFTDQTVNFVSFLNNAAPTAVSLSPSNVAENSANGTVIGTLNGTDPNAGDTLTYSLQNNAGGRFAVNSATGVLSVANGSLLDFETTSSHTISVRVTDSLGAFADFNTTVGVTDVAENFTLQLLHFADAEAGLLAPKTAPNLAALVDAFDNTYANTIILAGGDNFIPGPFLSAGTDPSLNAVASIGSTAPGRPDIAIHNVLGVQASTIGNHEFDLGSNVFQQTIVSAGTWSGALFPYLSSNLDFSGDAALNPLFTNTVATAGLEEASTLQKRIAPSAVITTGGEKIGLVGATTQLIESISSPTGTEVKGYPTNGQPGDNIETDNMILLAAQLQPVIDDLRNQGVNKIILMAHLQKISNEQTLATLLKGVDIILSAGSNTRLGDATDVAVAFPGHAADFANTYPLNATDADGKTTLIVNTDNEFTYLGRLVAEFDANGDIVPASLDPNINGAYAATDANVATYAGAGAFDPGTKGAKVKAITDAVQAVIAAKDGTFFGFTDVYLEGERIQVRTQETNLGNISADSMIDAGTVANAGSVVIGIKNGGGIRSQIGAIDSSGGGTEKLPPLANGDVGKPAGAVSQLDIENALRFNNRLMAVDTTAQGLLNILNSPNAFAANNGGFIQIGGFRVAYDSTLPAGQRVRDVALIDENQNFVQSIVIDGAVAAGAPATITMILLNFTANGGDGYTVKANGSNFRYLLTDGTLSAAVSPTLDFTAPANVPTNSLGEQEAFSDYLTTNFPTAATAFDVEDNTTKLVDGRIQDIRTRVGNVHGGISINGGKANEVFTLTNLVDVVGGAGGDDNISGLGGNDRLYGGTGNDFITGDAGIDQLFGEAGNDTLDGGTENDVLNGGDGDDTIAAGDGEDQAFGGNGNDNINGGSGNDILNGDDGDDTLDGGSGTNSVNGGAGTDTVSFASAEGAVKANLSLAGIQSTNVSQDTYSSIENLIGSAFNDRFFGNNSDNTLVGGLGKDNLNGGTGNDTLIGGEEQDILTGGSGADTFVFDSLGTTAQRDIVVDFTKADGDNIVLDRAAFSALGGLGTLSAAEFVAGTAATTADHRIIYNSRIGRLFYDADGNGAGTSVAIANIGFNEGLTASDFTVIGQLGERIGIQMDQALSSMVEAMASFGAEQSSMDDFRYNNNRGKLVDNFIGVASPLN